jgi:ferrous iron transport protein A
MKSLVQAPFEENCTIADLRGEPDLTNRLRELGFHPGCVVQVLGRAPFNGPLVVQLHNSVLALRPGEAECLLIK